MRAAWKNNGKPWFTDRVSSNNKEQIFSWKMRTYIET